MMTATSILHATGLTRAHTIAALLWISAALFVVLIICIARLFAAMSRGNRKKQRNGYV